MRLENLNSVRFHFPKGLIMPKNRFLTISGTLLPFLAALFLACPLPPAPVGPEEAKVELWLSSAYSITNNELTDTVDNHDTIWAYLNLARYIDSTHITVKRGDSLEYFFKIPTRSLDYDTVYQAISFSAPGDRIVTATSYITGFPNSTASATLHIVGRDPTVNRKPALKISGNKLLIAGETLSLRVSATDPDAGQKVTVSVTKKPDAATFANNILFWATSLADTGNHMIYFTAQDNSSIPMSITDSVVVKVSATAFNRPPEWYPDTIQYSGHPGTALPLSLNTLCTDPDRDQLTYSLLAGAPTGDVILESTWSFTPTITDTGNFKVRIVAKDQSNAADTLTIDLTIGTNSASPDTTAPRIARIVPAADSSKTNQPYCQITVSCVDRSGIATMKCSMGADTFHVTASSDTLYSVTVTNLKPSAWNTVRFIATDSAPTPNSCTLYVTTKYDPAAVDVSPPVLTLLSPSKDTVVGVDSCRITVRCIDESGVRVRIGNVEARRSADNSYSATVKNLVGRQWSSFKVVATDSAPAPHSDSITVRIKYDNDAVGPAFSLVTPGKDSTITNSSSYTVTVHVTDSSGILSVNGVMGSLTFPGTRSTGGNWTIAVTGLTVNIYNTIVFTATDSSLRANTTLLTMHIKYDPLIDEIEGPTILQVSGPRGGAIVTDPQVVIIDSITDPSGVDSVYWRLNGGVAKPMVAVTGKPNQYQLNETLTRENLDTIVVTAVDKSNQHNPSRQIIVLNYIIPPKITTQPAGSRVCAGSPATVSVVASGTAPLQYQWRTGAANPVNITGATNASYSVSAVNQTTILSCVVSNGSGQNATSSICTLTVDMPSLSAPAPESQTVCAGTNPNITVTATGAATLQWYQGTAPNGSPVAGATTATLTLTNIAASASYYCVATSSTGCKTTGTAAAVTVNPSPAKPVPGSRTVALCSGNSTTLSTTANPPSGVSWKWYTTNNPSSSNQALTNLTVSPTSSTSYYVRGETNSCGNSAWDSVVVTINPSPAKPTPTTRSVSVCPGSSTTLTTTATPPAGVTWRWYSTKNPSSSSQALSNLTVSPTSNTSYFVRGETNSCGNSAWDSVVVTVNQVPTATISGGGHVCTGTSTVFSVSGAFNQWQWFGPSGSIAGATTSAYGTSTPGTYYCRCITSAGCSVNSPTAQLIIDPVSVSSLPSTKSVCIGDPVTFTITKGCASTVQWRMNNGTDFQINSDGMFYTIDPTTGTLTFNFANAGIYQGYYYCVVEDNYGNSATSNSCFVSEKTSGCP
jgi:hypothetical protein